MRARCSLWEPYQGQRSRDADVSSSQVAAVHGEGLPSCQVPAVEPLAGRGQALQRRTGAGWPGADSRVHRLSGRQVSSGCSSSARSS